MSEEPYVTRLASDPDFVLALGRAHFNWVALEGIAIELTNRLEGGPDFGKIHLSYETGGEIAKRLARAVSEHDTEMQAWSAEFSDCVDDRNDLLHAHLYEKGLWRVRKPGSSRGEASFAVAESPADLYAFARRFEDLTIRGNDIVHERFGEALE